MKLDSGTLLVYSSMALWAAMSLVVFANAQDSCGSITIVEASTMENLTKAWAEAYGCAASIATEAAGSNAGISRACGTAQGQGTADVAGMTRLPFDSEATTEDGWNYECERSTRTLIGIDVAVEGISTAVSQGLATDDNSFSKESLAMDCLDELEGLSLEQLRWIFSSFTDDELVEDGWDSSSVPNLDDDTNTHLWSELSPNCEQTEIILAGPPVNSGAAELFRELVFGKSTAETFATTRPGSFFSSTDNAELSAFLASNDTAIAYFEIGYILTELNLETLALVSVKMPSEEGEDEIFKPSASSLEDGTYPLSRLLHLLVFNDEASLANTRQFVDFIFSEAGDNVTKDEGYWPLFEAKKLIMETRIQSKAGVPRSVIESYCGLEGGTISIAGSSTVIPIARLWSDLYSQFCSVEITTDGGGSSNGAGRVCGVESRGTPVDIGDMSREWKDTEAKEYKGFLYECLDGDTTRSAIQVDIAIDGLTVAVSHAGDAYDCIQILGGLTPDHLRWIYSSYNDQQLEATGWDPKSVPNSDRNSQTHKWNELHTDCKNIEIRIAGADDQSGTYEYFLETILTDFDNGETFDVFRPGYSYFNSEDDDILVDYIFTYPEAISYFGYNYYYENQESLASVPILNQEGAFVAPNPETIGDGSYNPLARRIYMNLLNDAETLQHTIPLVKFGLEHPETVVVTGYVPIPEDQAQEIIATRLDTAPFSLTGDGGSSKGLSGGAIAGIVVGSLVGLCIIIFMIMKCRKRGDKGEENPEEAR